MPRYLLSARTVLDILQKKGRPGEVWLAAATRKFQLSSLDVYVSAVTPMLVQGEIDAMIADDRAGKPRPGFSLDDLRIMRANSKNFFDDYAARERIVAVSQRIADRWGDLLDRSLVYRDPETGVPAALGSVLKLEIATAIIGLNHIQLFYVERRQDWHQEINGLRVVDPTEPV